MTSDGQADKNKRLPILDATLKQLFALSGNRCAFAGCEVPVINHHGQVVAQVAHIRGVKPRAPRFEPNASEASLRKFENLVILCNPHHIETDDASWTIERMTELKAAHEQRAEDQLLRGLRATLEDQTKNTTALIPKTLTAYAKGNDLSGPQAAEHLDVFRHQLLLFVGVVASLPRDERAIYSMIIDRGRPLSTSVENQFEVPIATLKGISDLPDDRLRDLLGVLIHAKMVDTDLEDQERSVPYVFTCYRPGGVEMGPVVAELKHLARTLTVDLSTFIVDLDFRALA